MCSYRHHTCGSCFPSNVQIYINYLNKRKQRSCSDINRIQRDLDSHGSAHNIWEIMLRLFFKIIGRWCNWEYNVCISQLPALSTISRILSLQILLWTMKMNACRISCSYASCSIWWFPIHVDFWEFESSIWGGEFRSSCSTYRLSVSVIFQVLVYLRFANHQNFLARSQQSIFSRPSSSEERGFSIPVGNLAGDTMKNRG